MNPLYPHQTETIAKILKDEKNKINGHILAFQMGLGKTRTVLEITKRKPGLSLVLCNKSNIKVWIDEINRFYPDTEVFVLHKDYSLKTQELTKEKLPNFNIIITSYDYLRKEFEVADPTCLKLKASNYHEASTRLYKPSTIPKNYRVADVVKATNVANYNILYSNIWENIIADESQRFVGVNTLLYRAVVALRGKSYYCLSGTPIVNYATDLYSQFKFMGLSIVPKDWNLDYYKDHKLDKQIISKDFSDTDIKLPECHMVDISIELSSDEKLLYNAVIDMLKQSYQDFQRGVETFAAPLAMLTRLRQICLCPFIITDESKKPMNSKRMSSLNSFPDNVLEKIVLFLDKQSFANLLRAFPSLYKRFKSNYWKKALEPVMSMPTEFFKNHELNVLLNDHERISHWTKMRKILKLVRDCTVDKSKIVVFSSFVSFLNVLKDKIHAKKIGNVLQLDGSTKDRDSVVNSFNNNPDTNILLCSYKSGGVGINLTAARYMILCDPWWNSAVEKQAICRIHRIGQKNPVKIFSLIVDKSVEMHLLNIQEKKNEKIKEYNLGKYEQYSRTNGSFSKEIIEKIAYGEHMV
jgi:SNF2 family DNA or RNA helicase